MNSMIKGIIFDLDHTLFDRYGTLRAVLPEMYKRLRGKIPEDLSLSDFIERFIKEEQKHIYNGWIYTAERMIEKGVFLPGITGEDVWQCLANHCWPLAAVKFPFTEPTLKKLKEMGYTLGIITNGEHSYQAAKLKLLDFAHYFDEIIISGDIGVQKPEHEPFDEMSRRLNIPANQLLYVGDNPLNDVKGSRDAGYVPVWVKTIGIWPFEDIERCEYEVETIEELPALLRNIK